MASVTLSVRVGMSKDVRMIQLDASLTVRAAIAQMVDTLKLSRPVAEYSLYIPTQDPTEGYFALDSKTLKSLSLVQFDQVILKDIPQPLHVCKYYGQELTEVSVTNDMITLKVDMSEPLLEMIPRVRKLMDIKGNTELYAFQHLILKGPTTECKWLNVNLSCVQQNVPTYGYLLLVPLSQFKEKPVAWFKGGKKEGYADKQSLKDGKWTPLKHRWFILHKNFLVYFVSQSAAAPKGVIALEYYSVVQKGHKTLELHMEHSGFGYQNEAFSLTFDSEAGCKSWLKEIKENPADKRVFGVDLQLLTLRTTYQVIHGIPAIVHKCVTFIQSNGMDTEGLFRVSGNAARINKIQEEFDGGMDVDFDGNEDIHVVCGVLKQYLRSLPEPLLTFALYDGFLAALNSKEECKEVKNVIAALPAPNSQLLAYLLSFLYQVSLHSKNNLMNPQNLGTVFGPVLLRNKSAVVIDSTSVTDVITLMIENHDKLFPEKVKQTLTKSNSTEGKLPFPKFVAAEVPQIKRSKSSVQLGAHVELSKANSTSNDSNLLQQLEYLKNKCAQLEKQLEHERTLRKQLERQLYNVKNL